MKATCQEFIVVRRDKGCIAKKRRKIRRRKHAGKRKGFIQMGRRGQKWVLEDQADERWLMMNKTR